MPAAFVEPGWTFVEIRALDWECPQYLPS